MSQFLFVNGREVKSHVLSYAVKQSFYSLLPKEKYPVFLLLFEIDPKIVDVNVHPRKLEVRFSDEREIFKIVAGACGKALEKHVLAPQIKEASDFDSSYNMARSQQQTLKLEDHDDAPAAEIGPRGDSPVSNYARAGGQAGTVADALNFTRQFADLPEVNQNDVSGDTAEQGSPRSFEYLKASEENGR